MRIEFKESELL